MTLVPVLLRTQNVLHSLHPPAYLTWWRTTGLTLMNAASKRAGCDYPKLNTAQNESGYTSVQLTECVAWRQGRADRSKGVWSYLGPSPDRCRVGHSCWMGAVAEEEGLTGCKPVSSSLDSGSVGVSCLCAGARGRAEWGASQISYKC